MLKRFVSIGVTGLWLWVGVTGSAISAVTVQQNKPELQKNSFADSDRSQRMQSMLDAAVRHELLTLPYYDVFDWLEADVLSNGGVVLRGEVVRPTTSQDAEKKVRRIESVSKVDNQIKVLPLSPRDSELRIALYRAIYDWNSPLFRYATRAMPPIHILVENGRITLKGAVATELESQLASQAVNRVSGIFEVRNELRIDN